MNIPLHRQVPCAMCGNIIDTEATTTYQAVDGWARNRNQGGTNALALRRTHQRWACSLCIDRLSNGLAIDQGELFR